MADKFTSGYAGSGVLGGNSLNAEDWNFFRGARQRVESTYELGRAQNLWQKQIGQGQYNRNVFDLTRKYDALKRRVATPFAKAGTLNSGLYKQAWGDYALDRSRNLGNLAASWQDQQSGLNLAAQQLDQTWGASMDDIDSQEAARRAAAAAIRSAVQGSV